MAFLLIPPDPGCRLNECTELLEAFSKDEIVYSHFARLVAQWHRYIDSARPNLDEYVSAKMNQRYRETGWSEFDISLDQLRQLHRNIFGQEWDLLNKGFFEKITNPVLDGSRINLVIRESTLIRDKSAIRLIHKYWKEKKNLFVVYGASHAVMQEEAIRHIVASKAFQVKI
jgi:hypothetical protein